jgi:MoxR-like ATPase
MNEVKEKIIALQKYLSSQIIGQKELVRKLVITLLADGHALLEGAPGLAKTKAIKTLAQCVTATYNRIQFTPDLLPSDITGSDIYIAERCDFEFRKGPVFANMVLADEINRAPAKVQSALLEAMAERQVSVGGKQYKLPELFMVLATQNPIEQEGTYNLPEAQLDRFLMYIKIGHPDAETERKILKLVRMEQQGAKEQDPAWQEFVQTVGKISVEDVASARKDVLRVHMSSQLEEYMVQLIMATRNPEKYDSTLKRSILFGASPRATIALDKCAKINAWLDGRDFVTPEDVHAVIYEILRHRIILSFEAQAEGVTTDDVITSILKLVPLP